MSVTLNALDGMNSPLWSHDKGTTERFSYTPYGATSVRVGTSLLPGFNGERLDPVSLTYHLGNGYRAYTPALMRFNTPDAWSPYGAGGLNPYSYCEGDPINRADPSGHLSGQAWAGIAFGILGLLGAFFSAGMSIAAAGGIVSAVSAASVVDLVTSAAGVAADVTSIACGASSESDPKMSQVLGWMASALGAVGAVLGLGHAGKSIYSKFTHRIGSLDLITDDIEMLPRPGPSTRVPEDLGPTGPHHMRGLSLDAKNLPMVFGMKNLDDLMRAEEGMRYLTLEQREAIEVTINDDGWVVFKKSGLKLDTGIVYSEYVLSLDNKLYVNKGRFHSEIMSGGAVRCAGCVLARNGVITSIDNVSGHHRPSSERYYSAMHSLLEQGFINDHTRLGAVNGAVEPAHRALGRRVSV